MENDAIYQTSIQVCRILEGKGLVEGFGHVSARLPEGDILITPARGLRLVEKRDLLVFNLAGTILSGNVSAAPLERWMHLAIYRVRPEVGAICRTHSPMAVVLGAASQPIRTSHGFGGMLGPQVPVHSEIDLITMDRMAQGVVASLGNNAAALLRANGALVTGRNLEEACVRAIYLEEAAMIQVLAVGLGGAIPFSAKELQSRSRWYEAETRRAWEYYAAKYARRESIVDEGLR
jgi:HCOMODA/2-hydroxy-3-carboxy-muconic semialdehyde decarboxylase